MKKNYLIVLGKINDSVKVERYRNIAGPIMKQYGGIMPPVNYTVESVYVGKMSPTFMLQVEFPSVSNIDNALADQEYIKVISDRDEGFSDLCIFCISK